MRDSVKELSQDDGFPQDSEKYLTDSVDHVTFIHRHAPTKKEDLN